MKINRAVGGMFAVLVLTGAMMSAGSLPGYAGEAENGAAEAAPMTEAECIAVLQSDADWLAKQTACRRLVHVGTQAAIPALAALLPDETLSHMARYALEPMQYAEVDQALREGLSKAEGMPKAGIIISIGVRRDAEAVPLLIPLIKADHVEVARTAAGALGRIATPEAMQALRGYRTDAPETTRAAVTEGLLAAAQALTDAGQGDQTALVYQELLAADAPVEVRMGAFRGLTEAQPSTAPDLLIGALKGEDPMFRDLAAQIIAETEGAGATKRYAKILPTLPPGGQVALLRGLADRGDAEARPVVIESVKSSDAEVALAAINALGVLGSEKEDVATLVALLSSDSDNEAVLQAAEAALISMEGDAVDASLTESIQGSTPAVHARLVTLLGNRRAAQAIPEALDALKNADPVVRSSSLDTLALLGGPSEAPAVIDVISKTGDVSERAAAETALNKIAARKGDEILPAVLDAMSGANDDVRLVLLQTAAEIGSAKALEAVLAAMSDTNPDISGEAVRMLSNWATLDAASHLEALAKSEELTQYVLGLRGYVRLAREQAQGGQKVEMLKKALVLARRPDEVKLVLGAWGTLKDVGALNTLEPFLDNPEVRQEAALAIVGIAGQVDKNNAEQKTLAVNALNAVIAKCEDAGIKANAQKVLDGLK